MFVFLGWGAYKILWGYMTASNTEFRKIGTFTIANSGTISNILDMADYFVAGLEFPAMSGTVLTLEGSTDGITFRSIKTSDLATNYSALTVDATGAIIEFPTRLAAARYYRATATTSQAAERSLDLLGYRS
jgi:hypothetical protein